MLGACAPDMKTAGRAYANDDFETARLQYEKLAAKGFPKAQVELGKMYLYGKGQEKDPEKALELFRKADRPNGDPLAGNYIKRTRPYLGRLAIRGEAKNHTPQQGLAMLREAARDNDPIALFELGYAYETGLAGLPPDGAVASEYYAKSARAGYNRAIHYQASLYEKGILLPQNSSLAANLYKSAIDSGYPRSAINLGRMYERGIGVPKDMRAAMEYYLYAENKGIPASDHIDRLNKELAKDK